MQEWKAELEIFCVWGRTPPCTRSSSALCFPAKKKKKKEVVWVIIQCAVITNVTHLTHFHMFSSEFLFFLCVLLVLVNDKNVFFAADEEESYFFIRTSWVGGKWKKGRSFLRHFSRSLNSKIKYLSKFQELIRDQEQIMNPYFLQNLNIWFCKVSLNFIEFFRLLFFSVLKYNIKQS